MIKIVEGKVGAGKSVYAVRETIEQCAKGGYTCTNIEMKRGPFISYLRRNHQLYVRSSQLIELGECENIVDWWQDIPAGSLECPILVIIDETHLEFNARNWQHTRDVHSEMMDFLTQSRKVHVNIIFITQDQATIDKQMRTQAERVVSCRNMTDLEVPVLKAKLFNSIWYTERSSSNKDLIYKKEKWRIDSEVFEVYNSFALLSSSMKEWLEGREQLGRVKLRKVSFLRKWIYKLTRYGGLDAKIAKHLRPIEAWLLKRRRRQLHAAAIE